MGAAGYSVLARVEPAVSAQKIGHSEADIAAGTGDPAEMEKPAETAPPLRQPFAVVRHTRASAEYRVTSPLGHAASFLGWAEAEAGLSVGARLPAASRACFFERLLGDWDLRITQFPGLAGCSWPALTGGLRRF
jgi:hypothetical protein